MDDVGLQAREPETALHPTTGLGIHSVVPVVFLEGSRGPKTPHPPPLHLQNTHTVSVSCTNETVLTSFRRTADRVPDRIATPPKAISDPAAGYWQQHTLETLNRDSWGGWPKARPLFLPLPVPRWPASVTWSAIPYSVLVLPSTSSSLSQGCSRPERSLCVVLPRSHKDSSRFHRMMLSSPTACQRPPAM